MNTKSNKCNLIFAMVILCLIIYLPCQAQVEQVPTSKEFDWVNERFESVLEKLFPVEGEDFLLGYRSYRDLYTDDFEYYFVIKLTAQEKYPTAILKMPDTVSIYDQIMALHRKNPAESIESIKSKLKIKAWELSDKNCPAIRTQSNAFNELKLEMLSDRDRKLHAEGKERITLHPRIHTFYATISGGSLNLFLRESNHPFAIWAKQTQDAFGVCALKTKSKAKTKNPPSISPR